MSAGRGEAVVAFAPQVWSGGEQVRAAIDADHLAADEAGLAGRQEADHIGVMYMARAGYNPEESVRVIEHLEEATAGLAAPPALLSTHPSNPERLLQLIDLMPKALVAYRQSGAQSPPVIAR